LQRGTFTRLQAGAIGREGNLHFAWWNFTWRLLRWRRFSRRWRFPTDDDSAAGQADQRQGRDDGEHKGK
jgi:hypothetical protein